MSQKTGVIEEGTMTPSEQPESPDRVSKYSP
jgi:hypothetical protein